jgi:hypothetical protein
MFTILFFETDPATGDLIDADPQTPELDPANNLDSPLGRFGIFTSLLFHNELGGFIKHLQVQPSDMNRDRVINVFDIAPFVLALTDPDEYRRQFNMDPNIAGDLNGDGVLNVFDIDCFVKLLLGLKTIEDLFRDRLDRGGDGGFVGVVSSVALQLRQLQALVTPDADNDGDGQTNMQEALAGTDPEDRADYFHIESVAIAEESVEIRWSSVAGKRYNVEMSETTLDGSWKVANDRPIEAGGASTRFETKQPRGGSAAYYRAVLAP